jgi:NIMA (never in mitosis gene a)-related kinase
MNIGEGAYSQVYKVQRVVGDAKEYAMKVVDIESMSPVEQQNALNEIRFLASIRHPNVLGFREAFIDPDTGRLWYDFRNDSSRMRCV